MRCQWRPDARAARRGGACYNATVETIRAIYENGVFRPTQQVELPEKCEVEFEPRPIKSNRGGDVYDVLSERYDSGEPDVSQRHNEHQP